MPTLEDTHQALLREALQRSGTLVLPAQGISMAPVLKAGDRLVVAPLGPEGPQVGQVVALWHHGHLVAHRIVALRPSPQGLWLLTKGDTRSLADPEVPSSSVLGVVEAYERGGKRHPIPGGWQAQWKAKQGQWEDRAATWGLQVLGWSQGMPPEALAALSLAAYCADLLSSPSLPHGLDWQRLLQLARAGRLTPLYTAKTIPGAPQAFLEACWADRKEAEARSMLLELAWTDLAPALAAAGVPTLLVKGPAVAEACYALPGWRPMVDLDLVVPAAHWDAAVGALAAAGFRAEAGRWARLSFELTGQEAFAKGYGQQAAVVELHQDLRMVSERMGPASGAVDMERAWQQAKPFSFGRQAGLTLGDEDALTYACTHWLQHHAPASIWLVDLAVMAKQGRLDWQRLVAQAKADGTAHALWAGLAAAAAFLHAPVPQEVLISLAPPGLRGRLAWRQLLQVVPSRFSEQVDRHSVLLQLATLPSWRAWGLALLRGAWPSATWLAQQAEGAAKAAPKPAGAWRLRAQHLGRLLHLTRS